MVVRLVEASLSRLRRIGRGRLSANRLESMARPGTVWSRLRTLTLVGLIRCCFGSGGDSEGFTQPIPVFSISGQRAFPAGWRGGEKFFVLCSAVRQSCNACISWPGTSSRPTSYCPDFRNCGHGKSRLAHELWPSSQRKAGRLSRQRPSLPVRLPRTAYSSGSFSPGLVVASSTASDGKFCSHGTSQHSRCMPCSGRYRSAVHSRLAGR